MSSDRTFDTSLNEQQYWLLNQQSRAPAYNINSYFHFQHLNVERLIHAVKQVVNTVELLSSNYRLHNHNIQRAFSEIEPEVFRKEFNQTFQIEAGSAIDWIKGLSSKPFNLQSKALVRLIIAEYDDKVNCIVCLSIHHIIMDARTKIVVSELISSAYNLQQLSLTTDELREVNNYPNYVKQQQEWLASEKSVNSKSYWEKNLLNIEKSEISLPSDENDCSNQASIFIDWENSDYVQLSNFSKQNATSNFIVLLTAYATLLYKYTKTPAFCIGVPLSNRQDHLFKNTVGCFVNIVPILIEISDDMPFLDLLAQVRHALLHAHRHQRVPTMSIFESQQHNNRTVYNYGFTYEEPMSLNLNKVTSKRLSFSGEYTQLDIFLRLWEGDELNGSIEFNPHQFPVEYVKNFVSSLKQVIQSVTTDTPINIEAINYCGERSLYLISEYNQTKTAKHYNQSLISLFEAQVIRTPEQVAVFDRFNQLTYACLNREINQWAHYLIDKGVVHSDNVGVLLERSINMLIATYAVLKVGAVFVPIDVNLPSKRISLCIEQANIKHIITSNILTKKHPDIKSSLLIMDRNSEELHSFGTQNLNINVSPKDLAYIIFTSGSTGVPKGVMIRQNSIVNRLLWMQREFSANNQDVILHKTPHSFDVSVWELFWPLQVGSVLYIAEQDAHKNPYELQRQLIDSQATVVHFVPTMLRAFLALKTNAEHNLRTVICSGEALSKNLVDCFYQNYPDVKLVNLYGPTEAAIDVSIYHCIANDPCSIIPIGRAVDNTKLFIVDKHLNLVPVGASGEIAIAGIQVAEGYVNNHRLTSEVFVDSPLANNVLYLTGDTGRMKIDGNIEYLGRIDDQVKINGIRVELQEIEYYLANHDLVQSATVLNVDIDGTTRLVAFYISRIPLSEQELIDYMSSCLPTYMSPSALIRIDSIPTTINGKIDKKILLEKVRTVFVQRRGAHKVEKSLKSTEQTIVQIFQNVLTLETVTVDKPFFEMGADSLTLMVIYEQLKTHFPVNFKSMHMFKYPTIKRLASFLDGLLE